MSKHRRGRLRTPSWPIQFVKPRAGHDDATPARALAAVTVVIGSIAAVLIAALLILWYVLK